MKKNCVILGPTNIEKIQLYGNIENIDKYAKEVGDFLAKNFEQVIIIPDNTFPLKIAKIFKEINPNGKVVGYAPSIISGGDILNEYFKYCDEVIKTDGGWFNLNTSLIKNSEMVFCFGFSAGVFIELCSVKYNQVYLNLDTHIYIDERTISAKLPREVEVDLKNLYYFNNFNELENEFKN